MEKNIILKYPRRTTRKINGQGFELSAPSERTSATMQNINSTNTTIENIIEEELKTSGINYTKPDLLIGSLSGKPDFVLPKYKIAIFCDGDFWKAKIQRNIERDKLVSEESAISGWKVFRFWEHQIRSNAQECVLEIQNFIVSTVQNSKPKFTFVDLFSGIGGFRIALEQLGGKCLGFSEIDKRATEVYKKNFLDFTSSKEIELGDVTKLSKLPFKEIDLIVGGVPCQSWSVAGKMKGFEDPRGRLWHDSIRIVQENNPKAFIFENVKGLMDPRNKANLDLILSCFDDIGYNVRVDLLNSHDFGLPQNRDRIFLVGFKKRMTKAYKSFEFPTPINEKISLSKILGLSELESKERKQFSTTELYGEKIPMSRNRFQNINELNDFFVLCDTRNGHTTIHSWDIIKTSEREKEICMLILKNRRKSAYGNQDGNPLSVDSLNELLPGIKLSELKSLVDKKILRLVEDNKFEFVNSKNSAGINGIYRVYLPHARIFSTLTATGTKDFVAVESILGNTPEEYKTNFIRQILKKKAYRPISAKEAGRLQGFPDTFIIDSSEPYAKKQFGNAVSTNVIYYLASSLIKTNIFEEDDNRGKRINNIEI